MKIYSLAFFRHHESVYETDRVGESQGVLFSRYVLTTVQIAHRLYPDWEIRVHHDDRVQSLPSWEPLVALAKQGVCRLVDCGVAPTLCTAMLWRLKPLWEPKVEIVACRDLDALPMPRERVMLEEFLASDALLHGILDSESHSGPLMGGMMAAKAAWKPAPTWDEFIAGADLQRHGSDQVWLNQRWRADPVPMLVHQRGELVRHDMPHVTTRAVAPHVEAGDGLCPHIGAMYYIEPARRFYGLA